MTKNVTAALCNNFGDVFGKRTHTGRIGSGYFLDDYVAANFALMPEGATLVTLSPLVAALKCAPLSEANKRRATRGHCGHDSCGDMCLLASFYETKEVELGIQSECCSWSAEGGCKNKLMAYVYTRVKQGVGDGIAYFLCTNFGQCEKAKNNTPIKAVQLTDEGKAIILKCECGGQRHFRRRKNAPNYKV